jgi:hypothetical protein
MENLKVEHWLLVKSTYVYNGTNCFIDNKSLCYNLNFSLWLLELRDAIRIIVWWIEREKRRNWEKRKNLIDQVSELQTLVNYKRKWIKIYKD